MKPLTAPGVLFILPTISWWLWASWIDGKEDRQAGSWQALCLIYCTVRYTCVMMFMCTEPSKTRQGQNQDVGYTFSTVFYGSRSFSYSHNIWCFDFNNECVQQIAKASLLAIIPFFSVLKKRHKVQIWSHHGLPNAINMKNEMGNEKIGVGYTFVLT